MSPLSRSALLLLPLLLALPAAAAEPVLEPFRFADLNQGVYRGSLPWHLGEVGGIHVFVATDDAYGNELWRTDGTPRGTFLLADLCPGRCSSGVSTVTEAPEAGLLFLEVERRGGAELWRTDGTRRGTFRLHRQDSDRRYFLSGAWNRERGLLVFLGADRDTGLEPWVSDGTVAGTRRLADLVAGPVGSEPHDFRVLDGEVYFVAAYGLPFYPDVPPDLSMVWRTDGTPGGTEWVHETATEARQRLVGPVADRLLRVTDLIGPFILGSIAPGEGYRDLLALGEPPAGGHGPRYFVRTLEQDDRRLLLDLRVLVGAEDAPEELWATDGTPEGTHRILEYGPVPRGERVAPTAGAAGDRTVFRAWQPETGWEPWTTDGTPEGTGLLADLCPGPCSSQEGLAAASFRAVGERLVFRADDGATGVEAWSTDGTAEGTVRLVDACAGTCSGALGGISDGGWMALTELSGREALWHTDGTVAGTSFVFGGFARLAQLPARPEGGLLAADDGASGLEPWWTDGTAAGTRPLGDLLVGWPQDSRPDGLTRATTAAGERLFFRATGTDGSRRLWVSDGTVAGTRPVPDRPDLSWSGLGAAFLEAGAGGLFLLQPQRDSDGSRSTLWWSDGEEPMRQLLSVEDSRRFVVGDGDRLFLGTADGLWVSDGTVAGTRLLTPVSLRPGGAVLVGGRLYFAASEGGEGDPWGLWVSDGTPEGTALLYGDPVWGSAGGPGGLVADGEGGFWFVAAGDQPNLVWRSDGTAAGTRPVLDLASLSPEWGSMQPHSLLPAGDRLFFQGSDDDSGWWVSDGTAAGTRNLQAGPLSYDTFSGSGTNALVFRDELVFVGADHGLYRTVGSDGGTPEVRPLLFAFLVPPDRLDAGLFVVRDRLFVVARLPGQPWQMWMLEDLDGPAELLGEFPADTSPPDDLTPLGTRIFFGAGDFDAGDELWAMDLAAPPPPPPRPEPACVPDGEHLCLLDGRFRVGAEWRDPRTGDAGTAGVVPFASDRTGTFWFFDPANVELIVKMLDGEPVNGFYWTFYGALSDVEYWIDVEDTVTGWTRTYHNPPLEICGRADTGTFETGASRTGASGRAATAPVAVRRIAAAEMPACTAPGVLCLHDGRFRLEVSWRDPRTGNTGTGTAIAGTDRSGYFWFFRDDNVELVAKVLDGRPVNGHHWVFWGSLTDVEYDLRVIDAEAGEERTYHNPPGNVCGGADTAAFWEEPAKAQSPDGKQAGVAFGGVPSPPCRVAKTGV